MILDNKALLTEKLKEKAFAEGFNPIGIANVPGSIRIQTRTAALQRWLDAGYQAEMNWMQAPRRQNIESLLDGVQSVVVVGLNYFVDKKRAPNSLKIARYAWGNDYHKIIEKKLKRVGIWLKEESPDCRWRICVDSTPLLEKAWAEEAGVGWIGKNSNLINSKTGSWMVLGFLLTTEKLEPDKPAMPKCEKCNICINLCPTDAITEPFVINANKCISYHTIENRNIELPSNIEKKMGNWVAGCDICQETCPWNKDIESNNDIEVQPKNWLLNIKASEALKWDENTWKEKLKGSSLKRIKPWMWKRNISAAVKNKGSLK